MNRKLADSHTASKTRWALLGRLLYNERIPAIPPLLVDGKFFSNFYEKETFLITFASMCTLIKTQAPCHPFGISKHQNKVL